MLEGLLCILVGVPLGILSGKIAVKILKIVWWGNEYELFEVQTMEALAEERGGFNFINPNEMEILDRIAEVVPIRQIWLADDVWQTAGECLRVSGSDLEELAKKPTWYQFMKTRFFDGNGDYFHPLLFVRQSARANGFIIENFPKFTRVWLRYDLPPTLLKWKRWDMFCVEARKISESEALALESRNIEILSQVDSILDSAYNRLCCAI